MNETASELFNHTPNSQRPNIKKIALTPIIIKTTIPVSFAENNLNARGLLCRLIICGKAAFIIG